MFGVLASIALTVSSVNGVMLLSEEERLAAEETQAVVVYVAHLEPMTHLKAKELEL